MKKRFFIFIFMFFSVFLFADNSIGIKASMLNVRGQPVVNVYPNDVVKFNIRTDRNCYIAILCVDAKGGRSWLPIENNYMEANVVRTFPDFSGRTLRVSNDGVFGSEEVVIYASNYKDCLPSKMELGKFNIQDYQMIMRRQRALRTRKDIYVGLSKISYNILRR